MVDALVLLEGLLEQLQDGLVVCHVRRLEQRARGLGGQVRVRVDRPVLEALSGEMVSPGLVKVSNRHVGVVLAAQLDQTGADAVGAACLLASFTSIERHTNDEDDLFVKRVLEDLGLELAHGDGVGLGSRFCFCNHLVKWNMMGGRKPDQDGAFIGSPVLPRCCTAS